MTKPTNCDRVAIHWIKPSRHHARLHPAPQLKKLEKLIREFGQIRPLIVTETGELVDGHAVWQILAKIGHDHVDVVIIHDQSDARIRALRINLNRTAELGAWNNEKLRTELQFFIDIGFDIELTTLDTMQIDFTLDADELGSRKRRHDQPLPFWSDNPVVRPGEIYQLGQHRVGCGDALDAGFANRICDGQLASACIFDPPGRSAVNTAKRFERSGRAVDIEGQLDVEFYKSAFGSVTQHSNPGALIFAFGHWRDSLVTLAAAQITGLSLLDTCVWLKNAEDGGLYSNAHELVHIFAQLGQSGHLKTNRSNFWNYQSGVAPGRKRDKFLAAAKPVDMLADAILDATQRGDAVYCPFLNCGSALMATEQTGRHCIGAELDARMVDITIRRWQAKTGQDAILLQTGQSYASRGERRGPRSLGYGR